MAHQSPEHQLLGGAERTSPLLETHDWRQNLENSLLHIRDVLTAASTRGLKMAIAKRRSNLSPDDARILQEVSTERPLILRHCMALGSAANPAKISVNEYRPEAWADNAGGRFVELFHNHRKGIVSHILSGGYTADEFRYPTLPEWPMDSESFEDWGPAKQGLQQASATYREGDVMWLHPDEIHRLRDIQPDTVTLLVETPRTRDYSVVFDPSGQTPTTMYSDMGGHYDALASRYSQTE